MSTDGSSGEPCNDTIAVDAMAEEEFDARSQPAEEPKGDGDSGDGEEPEAKTEKPNLNRYYSMS